jgi:zinc/manganese transport system substrate-binding protein
MAAATARWKAQLAPYAGARIFTHHRTLTYFADFAGLQVAGYLEPKPGVAPPPSHVAELVQQAKAEKVRAVVVESYYDPRSAAALERHAGTRTAILPGDVGASRGATGYEAWIDEVVKAVVEALR